jgi:hypothetical protein
MAEGALFAELIKNLDKFDRKLIFILDDLRKKQNRIPLITSMFELCRLLHLEYNNDNIKKTGLVIAAFNAN